MLRRSFPSARDNNTMYRIFFLFFFLSTTTRGQEDGDPCVHGYSNTIGECRSYNECESARRDYQRNRNSVTFCSYNAFGGRTVCCRDESNILNSAGNRDDRPIWGNVNRHDRRRISERKCEEYSKSVVNKAGYIALIPNTESISVYEENCEYTGQELIFGGEDTKTGEFPHMAAIGWEDFEGGYLFSCGGSLISPRFVVTAAHCQRNPQAQTSEPVIVRLGDQNIDNNVYDGANPVDIAIHRMHIHPDYNSPKTYDDIALLELVADVKFRTGIRPACLWTNRDFGGHKNVIATGWGVQNPATGQSAKELQKVSLPILNVLSCNRTLRPVFNRNWIHGFSDSQMCVGELRGGKDTCRGDSGGPIQVVSKDNNCIFHIVGITSFGKECSYTGRPAVYTRISSYVDWIESVVWPGQ